MTKLDYIKATNSIARKIKESQNHLWSEDRSVRENLGWCEIALDKAASVLSEFRQNLRNDIADVPVGFREVSEIPHCDLEPE